MKKSEDFPKDLENTILNADPKLNKHELLEDIFKIYVAKLFELILKKSNTGNRIPFDSIVEMKRNLINGFRQASLAEYQVSYDQYDELFESTVKEIFEEAAKNHKGVDLMSRAPQNLEINPETYINEGGLYIPEHLKN